MVAIRTGEKSTRLVALSTPTPTPIVAQTDVAAKPTPAERESA
ncbi:Uncharacterised protein [Mycobacteroides abscessus subsp. abscessus]|nr:Uncharacterised protein [Mycobacteroides abscessus subsp. abscessus]